MYDLLIFFLTVLATNCIIFNFVQNIFYENKIKKIPSIIIFVLALILSYFSSFIPNGDIKMVFQYFILFLSIILIFKRKLIETLNIVIFLQTVIFLPCCILLPFNLFFKINIDHNVNFILSLIISLIIFQSNFIINLGRKIIEYSSISIKDCGLTICLLITNIFTYLLINSVNENNIFYILIVLNLINFYFLIKIIEDNMNFKELTISYDSLAKYAKEYEKLFERERINTHEFNNQLITIGMLKTKKEIKEYINSIYINNDSTLHNYSELKHISNYTLKWFIYQKLVEAENKNIKISIFVTRNAKNLTLFSSKTNEFRDLFRILGILLDNAIENANYSDEKELIIDFEYLNQKIYFSIENTFQKNIKKGKDRGFGLKIIDQILKNYNIFELKTEVKNNVFSQNLIIDLSNFKNIK